MKSTLFVALLALLVASSTLVVALLALLAASAVAMEKESSHFSEVTPGVYRFCVPLGFAPVDHARTVTLEVPVNVLQVKLDGNLSQAYEGTTKSVAHVAVSIYSNQFKSCFFQVFELSR